MKDTNTITAFLESARHVLEKSLHPAQSLYWAVSENKDLVRQVCKLPRYVNSEKRFSCSSNMRAD